MDNYWHSGDHVVLRGVVDHRIWLAQSVNVVKDEPGETALLLQPGAQCAYPAGYWRWKQGDYSQGTRWQEANRKDVLLRELIWQTNRILMLLEPDKYYSYFLFWNHSADQFISYYVNFQLPYRRSHCGFDTLDLDLDIVIDPQYTWHWKDEVEFQDGIREGGIKDDWVQGITLAQGEVFDKLARRAYPFDGSWLDWQPNPSWPAPRLPEHWSEL